VKSINRGLSFYHNKKREIDGKITD
jgi:hypothetical protein